MTYHVELSSDGMLPIPEEMARLIGVKPGDRLSVDQSGMSIVVRRDDGRDEALTRLRQAMKGYSVDQFIAERGADWNE